MKKEQITKILDHIPEDEELICVWFARDDFPVGLDENGQYESLSLEAWNDVVREFEETKWDNPIDSSWTSVHRDIYKLVGGKTNVGV